jgi:hypothetical protein
LATIARRRSTRDEEPTTEADERPRRDRRDRDEEPPRRERPTRSRSSEDEDRPQRRSAGGFSSYAQKKQVSSSFASDFKPGENNRVIIKILDPEPFDVFNQHWVEEGLAAGKTRHSFVCRANDEYFPDNKGCPLCDLGENAATQSLFNVLDFTNPRKPEVKVWRTPPTVTDDLERASHEDRTSPLNREDLYFEVEMVKKNKKTRWSLTPVKARDLKEDFDIDPLDAEEIADFEEKKFDDRTAVTKVDSYEDLEKLADSIA